MLFQYASISSLTAEQKMRLMQQASRMMNTEDASNHVMFEGQVFSMNEVKSLFFGSGAGPQFLKG